MSSEVLRKQFTGLKDLLEEQIAAAAGPKVYRALLSQSDADAPVAVVLQNTLGAEITWSRQMAGSYFGALSVGALDVMKTFHKIHPTAIVDYATAQVSTRIEGGGIFIDCVSAGVSVDDQLSYTPVEIFVYP